MGFGHGTRGSTQIKERIATDEKGCMDLGVADPSTGWPAEIHILMAHGWATVGNGEYMMG